MEDLISIIGEDAAEKLAKAFGGTSIYIPTTIAIDKRNQMMRLKFSELLSQGFTCMTSYRNLSNEHGLSVRQVQNIVNTRY